MNCMRICAKSSAADTPTLLLGQARAKPSRITSCLRGYYSLFTTFSEIRGPFLAFRSEVQMRRLAARAAADRDQPSRLQGAQAVTDIALIPSQSPHQVEMARTDAALSAFILGPHLVKDLALQL